MTPGRLREELRDALTAAFVALQDPLFVQALGPSTQGGSLPGGARVPGTSFELPLAEAASRLQLLLGAAGPLLAAADFKARQAILEGAVPPAMHELFAEMASLRGAGRLQDAEAPLDAAEGAARFRAAVAALYPPKQQPRVQGLFDDPDALDAMPVQAFMAALVRNG
jgi:hypothetical protein